MADDEAQGPEETVWGAVDAPPDPQLPLMGFDEPLVWPESPVWDDMPRPAASDVTGVEGHIVLPPLPTIAPVATVARPAPAVEAGRPRNPEPPADSDAQWRPSEDDLDPDATPQHTGPLAGLGGGAGRPPTAEAGGNVPWPAQVDDRLGEGRALDQPPPDAPALGSIWSNDLRADPHDLVGFGSLAAPAVYAETERSSRGLRRRLDVRPGNAAVIGLISVVSLVLLGMFLSVRARNNDVPTDASQTRPAGDEVAVTGPLNTIPAPATTVTTVTTTVTTTAPQPAINLSDLVAATETTAAPTGSRSSGTTTPSRTSTATPTASESATTTPVTQAPATTAPPTTEATTPPAPPPVEEETPTTVRRPTITIPIPTFTIPTPSFTIPRSSFPGLSRTDD